MRIHDVLRGHDFDSSHTVYVCPNSLHEIHVWNMEHWQHWEQPYDPQSEAKGEGWGAESLEQYLNTHMK